MDNDLENKHKWIIDTFQKYFKIIKKVSLELISIMAEGLGKNPDYFDPWFKDTCSSVFRAIHYLPRSSDRAADHSQISEHDFKLVTPEHTDSGFITVLDVFNFPGLQVEIDGVYHSVTPHPNSVIVNIGDTLSRISGGKIKATYHRVVDIGRERFSMPFFFDPKYSAITDRDVLSKNTILCEEGPKDKPNQLNFGQVLCSKMTNAFGEWKGFEIPPEMLILPQKVNE